MKLDPKIRRLSDPGTAILLFFLAAFAVITACLELYLLAAGEAAVTVVLTVYAILSRRERRKRLTAYTESLVYSAENARSSTLTNFPLPMAVFRLDDSSVVWGNEMFFSIFGLASKRLDARMEELIPGFTGKWLLEGREQYPTLLDIGGRKYQLHGNLIRSDKGDENAYSGVTYWVDVTDADEIRTRFQESRPVPGIIILDNLEFVNICCRGIFNYGVILAIFQCGE